MVRGDLVWSEGIYPCPYLPQPRSPAEAVFDISGARPVGERQPDP